MMRIVGAVCNRTVVTYPFTLDSYDGVDYACAAESSAYNFH